MNLSIRPKSLRAPTSAGYFRRSIGRMVLAALFCLIALSVRAAEPSLELQPARLRLLYAESLFLNVNRGDALAAIKTWVEILGRRRGYELAVEIGFYDRVEEATARIREKTVDMITCTSLEYLQLTQTGQIEPVFSPGWYQVPDEYVMLTRQDRHFTTLADLRGKSVVFYRTGAGLGRLWIGASLGEQGLGSVNDFFGSISEALKVSSAILPVFFGKTDAAVVKRYSWETMKEMNPQLAVQLQILTNSICLPDAVICLTKGTRENPFRDDLIRGSAELHADPQGQQILLLFKIDKMVPFKPEYLNGVSDLKTRQAELGDPRPRDQAVAAATGKPKS